MAPSTPVKDGTCIYRPTGRQVTIERQPVGLGNDGHSLTDSFEQYIATRKYKDKV